LLLIQLNFNFDPVADTRSTIYRDNKYRDNKGTAKPTASVHPQEIGMEKTDRETWRPILFFCPRTGRTVQGLLAEEVFNPNGSSDDHYEPVSCIACSGVHFINPITKLILGAGTRPR
jgi:hypothetical protein